jgi:hypothetical protein
MRPSQVVQKLRKRFFEPSSLPAEFSLDKSATRGQSHLSFLGFFPFSGVFLMILGCILQFLVAT